MPGMSIFWIVTYSLGLIASFANPVFGVLTYLFEYYLRPSLHWYGQWLPVWRYSLIAALVLGATYLVRRTSLRRLIPADRGPAHCLLALALLMAIISPFAVSSSSSWSRLASYLTLIAFHGLIVATIRSEWALDVFVAANMAGAGWWGWESYRDPKRVAGRLANIGSGDTLGDNAAASHLLTVLPFVVIYMLVHKDKRLRALALLVAPFVVNAIILCNSRGATVALGCAVVVGLLVAKSGHRVRGLAAAVGFAVAAYTLADPEFIKRQQTISSYENDGSATGRLDSWQGGLNLIKDYPLGAGGYGYHLLSPRYIPEVVQLHEGNLRAPHNTLVLVTSEWGIAGLLIYLAYYGSCFRLLVKVRKACPGGGIWYYRTVAIQVAMVGVFVAGLFSDRLYAEAPYWMGALAVVVHRLYFNEFSGEGVEAPVAEVETLRERARLGTTAAARTAAALGSGH